MESEILAGLFGSLATLVGVLATYAISFSRDSRLQKNALKVALSVLASDLQGAFQGLQKSPVFVPSIGGIEAFLLQGHLRSLPPALVTRLLNIRVQFQMIHQLTNLKSEFEFARVASGGSWRGAAPSGLAESRNALSDELVRDLPLLVTDLTAQMDKI